jgi:tRNA U34 2-thiouridine synthase MnmA/TrmU
MLAIVLFSGGLDSLLAARLIQAQGLEVIGLKFLIPFCPNKINPQHLSFVLKEIDISDEFLQLLVSPTYGFGSNMNPCIDCKILMLTKARQLLPELGASFIVTGDVLGQRPMSQNKATLALIAKRAQLTELLVRPLCAKLLPPTLPEQQGWISRERLLDFSGRGRRRQIALAQSLGIHQYAQPAGGCLLTDPGFAQRLKDLLARRQLSRNNVELLKSGRHFRLSEHFKLVVGRNEKENEKLLSLAQNNDCLFMPTEEVAGPVALGRGTSDEETLRLCCRIVCRYCDLNGSGQTQIVYRKITSFPNESITQVAKEVVPLDNQQLAALRI